MANAPANSDNAGRAGVVTPLWREVWTGADASTNVWLVYGGATIAPFSDIWADGLRLRAAGGYGAYRYHYDAELGAGRVRYDYKATASYSEALVGYYKRLGALTAKAFLGIASVEHQIRPRDPYNAVSGQEFGPKGVVELWLNIGEKGWASLDLAYTSAHRTGSVRSRVGYRVLPTVSIGLEAAMNANAEETGGRGGAFVRYEWFGGEISLAGGVASGALSKLADDPADDIRPYATLNFVQQF